MTLSRFQYIIISYLLLLPVVLNLFIWEAPTISLFFGGIFVIFESMILGEMLIQKPSLIERLVHGFFLFCTNLLLLSSAVYIIWSLSAPAMALVLLLLPLLTALAEHYTQSNLQKSLEIHETSLRDFLFSKELLLLISAYFCLFFGMVWILLQSATTDAITSPWTEIPQSFWFFYFLATTLLLLISWFSTNRWMAPVLTSLHLLLSFSIGLFVYKLGYGFDPFIHQATERLILTQGVVTPKTPYYIGQYSFLVSLHKLIGIPLLWLDRLLVPVLASISLPFFFMGFLPKKKGFARHSIAWIALICLFLPFTAFVVTTPQGLANLFFLWIILASFPLLSHQESPYSLSVLWLFGFAATLIHPLTGIPAIILLLLLTLDLTKDKLRFPQWLQKSFYLETILIGSISIPLMFLLNTLLSANFSTFLRIPAFSQLPALLAWWPLTLSPEASFYRPLFFEFGYFIQANTYWIFVVIVLAVSYWFYARSKQTIIRPYLITSCIFVLNAIILAVFLEFPELIAYESFDYSRRLIDLALLSLIPLAALGLIWTVQKAKTNSILMLFIVALGSSWLVTGNLFASYPRENRFELSRQYNTSLTDFRTVNKINQVAKNDFVVLADQTVSAAAIAEFGFKHYHSGPDKQPIFYYPVPTSSPLYKIYLEMNASPSLEIAEKAKSLTGVDEVFFVVNDYWDNAKQITEIAKGNSANWFEIDQGKATVFVYRFTED